MSDQPNSSWTTYIVVIGLCVAIGFGAVYAMVGGADNRKDATVGASSRAPAEGGATSVTSVAPTGGETSTGGLTNDASAQTSEPSAVLPASAKPSSSNAVLTDDDGKPLNRGAMTTFVFKKQAMKIDKPPQFNGPDGQPVMLSDFKGKVVLLNLWATWCAPCRKEMPHLNELQEKLGGDQFEVVALSVDRGSAQKSKEFLMEVGATALKFYHDPSAKAGFSLMAIGMPTTLLFDREGREIGRLVGPAEWHSEDAKKLIRAAIAAG